MVLNWSWERTVASISRPSPGSVSSGSGASPNSARPEGVQEAALAGGLAEAEAVRVADARVEVLEAVEHLRHRVADPVVVLGVPLPGRVAAGQRGPGHAGQDRAFRPQVRRVGLLHPVGDVHHRHRVLDADSLLAAGLMVLVGARQAGQDQRLLAVHDVAAVELGATCTVSSQFRNASKCRRGPARPAPGCRRARRTPSPGRSCIALMRLDRRPGRARAADRSRTPRRAGPGTAASGRWSIPQVRLPCTLLWPRTGHGPAPSRPMLPRSSSTLTISRTVSDAVLMLGDAQAPGDDHPPGLRGTNRPAAGSPLVHAGASHQLGPRRGLAQRAVLLEAVGVAAP